MATTSVGVIGSGVVGRVLAAGFVKHGYPTLLGTRAPEKLAAWTAEAGRGVRVGTVEEAARFGATLVLAVKGGAAEAALAAAGRENLDGKLVLDATNPIADAPPQGGVLKFFTSLDESLLERLQAAFPAARLVKAWSMVGNALMVDPQLPGGPPTMFVCGNDAEAKREATRILGQFGWEAEDFGGAEAARAIEPLCILWCIPGFLRNDWVHAFKMLRP